MYCGDAIRGPDEECDDGNPDDTDFCTAACRVRDRIAVGPTEPPSFVGKLRRIPHGPHVAAASRDGAALLFVDQSASPLSLGVVLFREDGTRMVADGGVTVSDANPPHEPVDAHVAALPGNRYAVAWIANTSSGLSVVLRSVDGATGSLTGVQIVTDPSYSVQDADAVWTGTELIVAWTSVELSPFAHHARYRRYDADLQPLGAEAPISEASPDGRGAVLAPFADGWAATWLEFDQNSNATLVTTAAGREWRAGSFYKWLGDRPALAPLDSDHLLLTASMPVYEADSGFDQSELFGAVLDTAAPGTQPLFKIAPLAPELAADATREQRYPSLATAGGRTYLAWSIGPGQSGGSTKSLLKELSFGAGGLDLSLVERDLPHDVPRQHGFQAYPAIAASPWTAGKTLFAAWEDDDRTFGTMERYPDVLAELIPLPVLRYEGDAGHDR